MKMDTILFDLDGTLININSDSFIKKYCSELCTTFKSICSPNDFLGYLLNAIYSMINNDGSETNKDIFIKSLIENLKCESILCTNILNKFYTTGFLATKDDILPVIDMQQSIEILKTKGYTLVLATNPIFPEICIFKKIAWAGLTPSDFTYISTYENSKYCKPNPKYFEEILLHINKSPKQCLMVGNDVIEDMAAKKLNITTFLVADNIKDNITNELEVDYYGNSKYFYDFVRELNHV